MRHALTAIAVLAMVIGCASPGMPPGGPTISSFPRVIATLPDTNARNARPNKVLVRYDDVIGEQAAGGNLSRAVLISPWDGEPRVEWKRTGMTIRPKGGWRPNTAYTITILPGITDLKGQPSPFGFVFRFSTGPDIPATAIRGVAFDWVLSRPIPGATVQGIDVRDTTLLYLAVADSTGRFELQGVPAGTYRVRAFEEKTPNRTLEPREPWDTATVTLRDSARTDLYAFVHDTLPARISEVRQNDSVTISLLMDKPLLPGALIPPSSVRVLMADSTVLPVLAVSTAAERQAAQLRADSIARARDTTARTPRNAPQRRTIDPTQRRDTGIVSALPKPARAAPAIELFVTLGVPLKPATTYRIEIARLRNLLGVEGSATRVLITPRPTVTDTTRTTPPAARDTARVRPPAVPPRPPR